MTSQIKDKSDIAKWWADNPMTYGDTHGEVSYSDGDYEFGSKEFFNRVAQEFYSWNKPLHDKRPFDRIFPYDDYIGKKVLEIGCGMGTMAENWVRNGADFTGVDLNPVAVEQTTRRFELFELDGHIQQCDANVLPFEDNTFDYAYSWGVLHHSPDLEKSLAEMMRVVKPGGGYGIMLYNRESILHWYMTEFVEGYLHRESVFLNDLELASRYGDGAREEGNPHTWPVTKKEMHDALAPHSDDLNIRVLGTDVAFAFRYMLPGLGLVLPGWAVKPWARRWGWSLWMEGHKR